MSYVIVAAALAAVALITLLTHRLWTGNRLVNSLLTGNFDQSRIGRRFAAWFKERPARAEQRDLFVKISLASGGPPGVVSDRLMECIMKVWRADGARFGDVLAQELERLTVFDPPTTEEQARLQRATLDQFSQFKARLRALDESAH